MINVEEEIIIDSTIATKDLKVKWTTSKESP